VDVGEGIHRAADYEELRIMKSCRGEKEKDMEDKILDDDDIIDLTDLLEEGEPKKKEKEKKGGSPAPANEPDSFDLGKEISMEYEVSVEEIEQGNEGLDIDARLSSNEEVALTQGKEGGEGAPVSGEAGEVSFDDNRERGTGKTDLSENGVDTLLQRKEDSATTGSETDTGGVSDTIPEKEAGKGSEELISESASIIENAASFDVEKPVTEEPKDTSNTLQGGKGSGGELPAVSVQNPVYPQMTEDILGELRHEVPAMLEGIVKPLMAELVKEMVTATREQLPGIVEKVIREEIEKLKKLDS
jgi:hypothetical protein